MHADKWKVPKQFHKQGFPRFSNSKVKYDTALFKTFRIIMLPNIPSLNLIFTSRKSSLSQQVQDPCTHHALDTVR